MKTTFELVSPSLLRSNLGRLAVGCGTAAAPLGPTSSFVERDSIGGAEASDMAWIGCSSCGLLSCRSALRFEPVEGLGYGDGAEVIGISRV